MHPKLEHLFNTLEADKRQLFAEVDGISDQQFSHAQPGKWSVYQILAHLMAAEKLTLLYMYKKIKGAAEAGDTGVGEELKMILLTLSQRLPFKFKAPAIVVENTPAYNSLEELKISWAKDRARLRTFLDGVPDDLIKRKIYKHVRAGRLNIQHALKFSHEHFVHHWPQIKRLL